MVTLTKIQKTTARFLCVAFGRAALSTRLKMPNSTALCALLDLRTVFGILLLATEQHLE